MTNESDTLKQIKELNAINMEIYQIADKLKAYKMDFGLTPQHLRDATEGVTKAIGKLLTDEKE